MSSMNSSLEIFPDHSLKLKGVCFDVDGTLTNTTPLVLFAFRVTTEKFLGRMCSDEEIKNLFGPSEEGIIRKLVPNRYEECIRFYHRIYEQYHSQYNTIYQGVEDVLDVLRQKQKLIGIVTGKGPVSTSITLSQTDLAHFFDLIECGSPNGSRKYEAITSICRKWAVNPHEIAYVGDTASDLKAAIDAGAIPLGAAWDEGSDAVELDKLAYAVFPTVGMMKEWIISSLT